MTDLVPVLRQALDALECAKEETNSAEMNYAYGVVITALRAALAEQPEPVVLTGEDLRNIARSLPPADCDRLTAEWRSVSMFARAILTVAIPPGHVVVPVGEVEALRKDAERYRWLRELPNADSLNVQFMGTDLDRVVDAGIAARPGGEG